jgi:hypothetical protein
MEKRNPSDVRGPSTGPQTPARDSETQKSGTSNRPGNANESGSSGSTRRDDAASTRDR